MGNFGTAISKSTADQYFQNFRNIKSRASTVLTQGFPHDDEARRYLNGNDAAFVFEKKSLQILVERLTNDEDCIILFNGSRYDDTQHEFGRPTLTAFAYKITYDSTGNKIATIDLGSSSDDDDGFEHPGNYRITLGGSGPIPSTIPIDDISRLL
jgi:hypothetical protein